MEAQLIKISSDTYKRSLEWPKITYDSEWVYFGEGAELNWQVVIQSTISFVAEEINYVAIDRLQSFQCNGIELIDRIRPLLGTTDFLLWDSGFNRAIEFSHIGVLRIGKKASC